MAQAVQLALYSYCLAQALKFLFDIKGNILPIIIVILYLLMWSFIGENTIRMERIFFSHFASIVTLLAQYILPIILEIVYAIKHKKGKNSSKKRVRDENKAKIRDKKEVKVNI